MTDVRDDWDNTASRLLTDIIENCKHDPSDEDTSANERRVLLVKAWLALKTAREYPPLVNLVTQSAPACENRIVDYMRLLDGKSQGLVNSQLSPILELIAAARALDLFLQQWVFPHARHGYEVIPVKVDGCSYWLSRRAVPLGDQHPAVAQRILPRLALRYHHVVPKNIHGFVVDMIRLPAGRRLEEAFSAGGFRVYGATFTDGVGLDVTWSTQTMLFLVNGYSGDTDGRAREERLKQICDHIDRAKEDGVSLILFPELTVVPELDGPVLEYAKARGGPAAVALGSFHRRTEEGIARNIARVYSANGGVLVEHWKCRKAHLYKELVVPDKYFENIDLGVRIQCLATPAGVIAVAICMDFCDDLQPTVWDELSVDLVLVPSMGNESTWDRHMERAKKIFRDFGAETLLVQQMIGAGNGGRCFTKTSAVEDTSEGWLAAKVLA